MSGLLRNARKLLMGLSTTHPARVQKFSVTCSEGHRLSGLRTEGYQSLRCPTCGLGVFILPRSSLPEPVAVARQVSAPSMPDPTVKPGDPVPVALTDPPIHVSDHEFGAADSELEAADAEIEWVDEPENGPVGTTFGTPDVVANQDTRETISPPVRPSQAHTAGAAVSKRSRRVSPPARSEGRSTAGPPPDVNEPLLRGPHASFVRTHRNRLLVAAVVAVVIGTVTIRTWRSRLQELPRIAELGRVEGLTALDQGKFVRAHQLLSAAKRAVNALGDAHQGASAIKQGADEAEIISQLLPETLEALLDEASRADPKDWASRFDTLYKGRSLIVDAHILSAPDGGGEGRYTLDYQVLPPGGDGGQPRSLGAIDLQSFRLIELIKPKVGDRVTFGARLASFRFDLEREYWLIGLEPESGVIMTHVKALESLGWPSGADTSGEEQP